MTGRILDNEFKKADWDNDGKISLQVCTHTHTHTQNTHTTPRHNLQGTSPPEHVAESKA